MASHRQSHLADHFTSLAVRRAKVATNNSELNTFYLMWAGALIFLMQSGFAVLSAGSIRAKNVKNILLKNLLDACIGALIWYFIGYGFAYDADSCDSEAECAVPGAHEGSCELPAPCPICATEPQSAQRTAHVG